MRIADIEVDRRVLGGFRRIFPFWGMYVIAVRRRNQHKTERQLEALGVEVRRIVTEAQDGAKTLRRLTVWLVVLTILNVAFVAYSAFK
ncbi:MAG: hypothetical protein JWN81_369 [Solirubrobacterales bacterium]|nr:hypothetical protein [Solirubrobacterales bacterium]